MKPILPILSLAVLVFSSCGAKPPPATMKMSELTQAIWASWEESDVSGAPVFSVEGENVPELGDVSFSLQFQKNASSFTLLMDFSAMELSGLPSDLMAEIPDLTDSEVGMKASLATGMLFWGACPNSYEGRTSFRRALANPRVEWHEDFWISPNLC